MGANALLPSLLAGGKTAGRPHSSPHAGSRKRELWRENAPQLADWVQRHWGGLKASDTMNKCQWQVGRILTHSPESELPQIHMQYLKISMKKKSLQKLLMRSHPEILLHGSLESRWHSKSLLWLGGMVTTWTHLGQKQGCKAMLKKMQKRKKKNAKLSIVSPPKTITCYSRCFSLQD